MKTVRLAFLPLAFLFSFSTPAQVLSPAKWRFEVSKAEVKAGSETELVFRATIQDNWYLYSSDFDPELGPQVTAFTFKPNDTYQLVGKVKPVKPKKKYDDLWGGEYTYFIGQGEFRQTVKILKANPRIEGGIEYQVCSEVDGKCIPGEEAFKFDQIKLVAAAETSGGPAVAATEKPTDSASVAAATEKNPKNAQNAPMNGDEKQATVSEPTNTATLAPVSGDKDDSLGSFLLLAFLSGFIALAMPCVYPLIPMTVSFFTHQGGSRQRGIWYAVIYGLSIIVIYTLIGSVFSLVFGSDSANALSTHWLPNLLFFAVFVVFGLSFLGLFEIVLPSSLVNRVDREADKGGLYGIFFMAFTLALVSFSCTGPIAGSLLILASEGVSVKSVLGMVAYSAAFAVPFTLFAIFPAWLKNLPKSGGWMNTVKVTLGFLELALAFKFLSNADQVYHWGLLDRDVFLAAWIVIFGVLGLYLLGKVRLPHDDNAAEIGVPRLLVAMLTLAFTIYMVPGLFGAPLKPLAGLLPPQTTQDFNLNEPRGLLASQPTEVLPPRKHAGFLKTPHNLPGFFDLKEALAYAQKVNKPVFVDFTGHGCVNCREMEARVWPEPTVLQRLANDYVLVSLYVDDKTELPESEWYTSARDGKLKKTIGSQNFDYQITRFNYNAQPLYVLLDTAGNPLPVPPTAHDLSVENFVGFLDKGLSAFRKSDSSDLSLK
ncbi:MAG: thioredoxin family protein [Cytophagales bacterium]|jgi:thiol:disulfide interchange protein DsbD|nr:thioredoxin family protein [Cytophagales bacterium]